MFYLRICWLLKCTGEQVILADCVSFILIRHFFNQILCVKMLLEYSKATCESLCAVLSEKVVVVKTCTIAPKF